MIENLNPIPEEQANLHIVENMDVNNLPELMKSVGHVIYERTYRVLERAPEPLFQVRYRCQTLLP